MRCALLLLLFGCADAPSQGPTTTHVVESASFPAIERHAVDLLFQIDNSNGTSDYQNAIAIAIPTLLAPLASTDLHIGVATSDLGSSGAEPVGTVGQGGCAGWGDDGRFRTSGAPVRGTFIEHGETTNYDGELRDVLLRMLRIGSTGCGFEQPLAATRRALEVNAGFLRSEAALAIVMFADEDDCSIKSTNADAFLTKDTTSLGPLTSFRCTLQGLLCDEPMDVIGEKHNCRPNPYSPYLEDPAITRDAFAKLGVDRVTVSAIVGPASPVVVERRQINGITQTALGHACGFNSPTGPITADPAVRIVSVVDSFASRGSPELVCTDDVAPKLARIGMAIQRSLGIACLDTSKLADTLDTPGIQPACETRDVIGDITSELPRCPALGDCFDIVEDAVCADRLRVVVDRKTTPVAGTRVDVFCER